MNQELKKVKKWLDTNCLALNIDKTNFVIFHSPRTKLPEPIVIRFCRKRIQREKYVKFLGVLLDENLCWKYHINELSKKLSRAIKIFYEIRHFVPHEVLKLLYCSLFHSFLSYGIAVWGSTYKSYFQKLFVLQKKIIKVMTFNKQTAHSTPIFANTQLLKIDDIHQLQLLTFVYDCHQARIYTGFLGFWNPLKCFNNYFRFFLKTQSIYYNFLHINTSSVNKPS